MSGWKIKPSKTNPIPEHVNVVADTPQVDSTTRPPRTHQHSGPCGRSCLCRECNSGVAEAAALDAGLREAAERLLLEADDEAKQSEGFHGGRPETRERLRAALAAHRSSDPSPDRYCYVDPVQYPHPGHHRSSDPPPAPTCVECDEPWPCSATVYGKKDGVPHRIGVAPTGPAVDAYKVGSDDPE